MRTAARFLLFHTPFSFVDIIGLELLISFLVQRLAEMHDWQGDHIAEWTWVDWNLFSAFGLLRMFALFLDFLLDFAYIFICHLRLSVKKSLPDFINYLRDSS